MLLHLYRTSTLFRSNVSTLLRIHGTPSLKQTSVIFVLNGFLAYDRLLFSYQFHSYLSEAHKIRRNYL